MPTRAPRRIAAVVAVIGVAVTLVALGVRSLLDRIDSPYAEQSRCTLVGTPYSVSTEQAANAATVTAVALHRALPLRAMEIALAAALQESKLVNIDYGDRDSLGLFQQRPSQGWGTARQILDPRYSAGKFYDHLVRIPRWPQRPLAEVAQAVQQSGYPQAYSRWKDQAAVLARAFSGAVAAGLSCAFPSPTAAAEPALVVRLLVRELPARQLSASGRVAEVSPRSSGWATTTWLVAHADRLGIEAVHYAGRRWTRAESWQRDPTALPDRVRLRVAAPAGRGPGA